MHDNLWLRATGTIKLNKNLSTDFEIQHRRQNGLQSIAPIDYNLLFSFRNWIHYKKNEELKFSLSPIAIFSHYKIIQKTNDENIKPNRELRFSVAMDWHKKLYNKIYILNRNALEYRMIKNNPNHITRLRNKLGIKTQLNKNLSFVLYDEILYNVSGISSSHIFDHNRLGVQTNFNITKNLSTEIGYMYIHRLPLVNDITINENNFIINFTYQLLH